MQAVKEGAARLRLSWDEVYQKAKADIEAAQALAADMERLGHIQGVPEDLMAGALTRALEFVKKTTTIPETIPENA
jgi:malate dehydrogenase (oxaloacetate-decarboxylating)